ncbi:MAG: protein kinase [Chloroflexales bacterium]|nr:protein kinase [Chloroflexales bacterium]
MTVLDLLEANDIVQSPYARYTVLNLIGRGGMGAVYRVQRADDKSIWALKEMRPPPDVPPEEVAENRKLFNQEADLLQKLNHPNLPLIADHFENDGRPVLVMEFIPGQTLEDRLHEANAPLLEQQVIAYGVQLCRVLNYLHMQQPPIIFRDLKPSNIILTPDNVLKLIDFGVARTYKVRKSKDTVAMGSAGYAPPEQYGKGQTNARSDIYALGATLLHLLTNLPPVPLQPPQPGSISKFNPSVDAQTERVIIKAMALERDQRYASCAEMEQALHSCLDVPYVDPTTRTAAPPSRPPSAPPPQTPPKAQVAAPPPPVPPPSLPPPVQPAPPPVKEESLPCQHCGRFNKSKARFCSGCGSPMAGPPAARLMIRSPRNTWEMKLERLPFRIGRRDPRRNHYPELDLAEHDRGIASRNHATIQREGDFYTVTDLGSTNGTMLNGIIISPLIPQRLQQGDRIKVGEVEIEFHWNKS